MEKIALVTGITGQDGSYLAAFLLTKGYTVHGISRQTTSNWRLVFLGINDQVTLHQTNLEDPAALSQLFKTITPTEVYHLAAQSSVSASIADPATTIRSNVLSTLNLLSVITATNPAIRFFFASSSEIFDPNAPQPLTLNSPLKPDTPYGTSKLAGHLLVQQYRQYAQLYAVNGILFPHESPLRLDTSFLKSFIRSAIAYKEGKETVISIGDIDTERDFGDAASYVEAMWQSLQPPTADDYIIASGVPTSLHAIVHHILSILELPPSILKITGTNRPLTKTIYGDATETTEKLNWSYQDSIYVTIERMIEFERMYPTGYDT